MSEQALLDVVTEAIEQCCTCGCIHGDPMAPTDSRALAQSLISAVREAMSPGEGHADIL